MAEKKTPAAIEGPASSLAAHLPKAEFEVVWGKITDHIDVDERQATIELSLTARLPENHKATNVEVYLDLSQLPKSVVLFEFDDDRPIRNDEMAPQRLYDNARRRRDETKPLRFGDFNADGETQTQSLNLATGAFADWITRNSSDDDSRVCNPYDLYSAKGDETFEIRIKRIVATTVAIAVLPGACIIHGKAKAIKIEVRD